MSFVASFKVIEKLSILQFCLFFFPPPTNHPTPNQPFLSWSMDLGWVVRVELLDT